MVARSAMRRASVSVGQAQWAAMDASVKKQLVQPLLLQELGELQEQAEDEGDDDTGC